MNYIRKAFLILLIMISGTLSLFAEDASETSGSGDGQWWVGMSISDFEYTGLTNVEERTVEDVLSEYLGQTFSDELFTEIYNTLYAQQWVEYISAEALRGGTTGTSLVIRFFF